MNEIALDILAGGGFGISNKINSLGYYKDEMRLRMEMSVRGNYNPRNVCRVEQKLYDFLKNEKIFIGISHKFPCEAFVASHNGFLAVVMPADAEYREDQVDRLCALAHEIGHYFDLKYNYKFDTKEFDTKKDELKMRKKEVVAWMYAYKILDCLGFNKWEDFLFRMREALLSYFKKDREEEVFEYCSKIYGELRKDNKLNILL